jgi:hypothetical protein
MKKMGVFGVSGRTCSVEMVSGVMIAFGRNTRKIRGLL